MTISDFIALTSLASLVYFAYGTWRIDRTLTKVKDILSGISSTLDSWPHDR